MITDRRHICACLDDSTQLSNSRARLDSKRDNSPSAMARTCRTGPELKPTAAIGSSRPQPLYRNDPNSFTADIGLILATQVHDAVDSVILLPSEYIHDPEPDSPEASWRGMLRCQALLEDHSRIRANQQQQQQQYTAPSSYRTVHPS